MALDILKDNIINKILVVGHEDSNLEKTSNLMSQAGIKYSNNFKNKKLKTSDISKTILKSKKNNTSSYSEQEKVSKVWDSLALDLFLANIDRELWHWTDTNSITLLDYWKSLDDQLAFVLLYNDPYSALSNFLNNKEKLDVNELNTFLSDWYSYNTILLNFFYKNKDRALLINSNQLNDNHAEYIDELTKHIGLDVNTEMMKKLTYSKKIEKDIPEETTVLSSFISKSLLDEHPEVFTLYEDMQSVANIYDKAIVSKEKPKAKDALCELFLIKNRTNKLQNDNKFLRKNFTEKSIEFKKQNKKIKNKNKKIKNKNKNIKKQNKVDVEENNLLLQQLHHVQEELEKYYIKNKSMQEEGQELNELKTKVKNLTTSIDSEKIKLQTSLKNRVEEIKKLETKVETEEVKTKSLVKLFETENSVLLEQLHHVQEELEKYYIENQSFKENEESKRLYGAADRIKEELGYKLGAKMIEKSKSSLGVLGLPFSLMVVKSQYKKEMKIKKDQYLPPIDTYTDVYDAEKIKKHLSYMFGQTIIRTMKNPFGIFILPFRLSSTYKAFKKSKD